MADYKGQMPPNNPPPYPSGQQNYGFQGGYGQPPPPQQQPQQFGFAQQSSTNVVVAQVGGAQPYTMPPVDYTTQALIACLFCFWPTGLLAIMKANESRDAVARGDMVAAHSAANSARQMVRVSWIVGIISMVSLGIILGVYYGVVWNSIYRYDDY